MDVTFALAGLVVLAPVLGAVALAIAVLDGRPVLFGQQRAGRDGRPFRLLKFRTMRAARDGEPWYASDAARVTRLGAALRRTSLDELPQLWNVLRGEMSVVGPRPLYVSYVAAYTPAERRRLDVRPGITGLAVVHGRDAVPFERAMALDAWYLDHWSLGRDAEIILRTIELVLSRRNVVVATPWPEPTVPARFLEAVAAEAAEAADAARSQGRR